MERDTIEDLPECGVSFVRQIKRQVISRPLYGQALVATVTYLTAIANGLTSGYSAILLPQLRANGSNFEVNEDTESWIVSIYIGATSVGCVMSGIVMDMWGRRLAVQIAVSAVCIGWALIASSTAFPLMLAGRALGGFGKGLGTPSLTFHLEELADPKLRGALSACILLKYSIGIMVVSLLGTNISWRVTAILGGIFSLVNLLGYFLLPESPVWLVRNNRISRATTVFDWLWSGHHVQAERELQELVKRINDEKLDVDNQMNTSLNLKWKLKQYLRPHIIKPFFIIHIFNIMQILCGTNLFIFYATDIISGMKTDSSLDVNFTNIITSAVRVIFMIVSCVILVWIGRRPLCISSGLGSGIAAVILGTLIYIQIAPPWVLITLAVIYVAFNTYGFFVLPPSMIGEILPSKIRCTAGAYIFTANDIGMFGATKAFPSIVKGVSICGLFWIFGISSILCALFLYLLLPETKGRSLVQIEEYFLQPNILWHRRKKQQSKNDIMM